MQTRAQRLETVAGLTTRHRTQRGVFNGLTVDVTDCWGVGEGQNEMAYEGQTRVTALMSETGAAPCEPRLKAGQACPVDYAPRNIQFAPAGTRLWGYGSDVRHIRDVTLVLSDPDLEARLGHRVRLARRAPKLRFTDEPLWTVLKLLSETVERAEPLEGLYAEHLALAAVARLDRWTVDRTAERGLAPWRLRRVLDLLEARPTERVSMERLAAEAGLSQAHFARAFKASTGAAPYQWQLRARLKRAQAMLEETEVSVEAVAQATGFGDAAHLARRFRAATGTSPSEWRRDRKR
jgi:AraC family transcriptional regulator